MYIRVSASLKKQPRESVRVRRTVYWLVPVFKKTSRVGRLGLGIQYGLVQFSKKQPGGSVRARRTR